MTLAALIFDVDGTLADTEELHRLAFNDAFAEHGLEWHWSEEDYGRLLKTAGGKERIARHVDGLGLAAVEAAYLKELIDALHRSKTRRYADLIADGRAPLRPGVRRLLAEARAAGLPLAIASTTSAGNIDALLEASLGSGTAGWFQVIAAGDAVARKKPSPDIYRLALQRLGLPAKSCVAFEDSAIGLRAAKEAGLFTVTTPCRWTAGEDLSAADLLLPGLGDVDAPLDPSEARRIGGAPFLGLDSLRQLHALQGPMASC